ncbi:MAG: hypothetical protein HY688_03540, partial [Chloroflexi bacterium]|nr:hypothetical protein [Chloroflexota bacterium]
MTAERQVAIRLLGSPLWAVRVAWLALGAVAVGLWAVTSVRILREPFLPAAEVSDPSTFTLEDVEVLRSLGLPEALAMAPIVFFLLL